MFHLHVNEHHVTQLLHCTLEAAHYPHMALSEMQHTASEGRAESSPKFNQLFPVSLPSYPENFIKIRKELFE